MFVSLVIIKPCLFLTIYKYMYISYVVCVQQIVSWHMQLELNTLLIQRNTAGCRDRDLMVVELTTTFESVPITTNVVSANLDQGDVYNIM